MSIYLEVIVTSLAEAIAAEQGGADRLELVRALDQGGLTPSAGLVKEVMSSVSIPVRVMVRETDSMCIADAGEKIRLLRSVGQFCEYAVDGLVLGFLKEGHIDRGTLDELVRPDLKCQVTFHRAFDEATDPISAIESLRDYPQIDRILTRAGEGGWSARRAQLEEWQRLAAPNIQMLFAIGCDLSQLSELRETSQRYEVHVGRAARISHSNSGAVKSEYVAALKGERELPPSLETSADTGPEVV